MTPSSITITEQEISRITKMGLDHIPDKVAPVDPMVFMSATAPQAYEDSGILTPGLLQVRRFSGLTQVAVQVPPTTTTIFWGFKEGTAAFPFRVAMPWRVILALFDENILLGVRIFYSPQPITRLSQVLYHSNLPNVNCRGYGDGNAVGWICLYGTHGGWSKQNLGWRVRNIMQRACSGEPFNDYNMYETDGARFYRSAYQALALQRYPTDTPKRNELLNRFEWLWNPVKWEEATEAHGTNLFDLDDCLIPVLVQDADNQTHHAFDGVPLTFGMALYGKARYGYGTHANFDPANTIATKGRVDHKTLLGNILTALKKTPVTKTRPNPPDVLTPPQISNQWIGLEPSAIKRSKGTRDDVSCDWQTIAMARPHIDSSGNLISPSTEFASTLFGDDDEDDDDDC